MMYLELAMILIMALYAGMIGTFIIGWLRIKESTNNVDIINKNTRLSVVIALKNETENIKSLIDGLKQQSLQADKFEVILVNDNSTDDTYQELLKYTKDIENWF